MALTSEQIAHALQKKAGNITDAAKALKVSRQALHKRISDDAALQEVLTNAREALVDVAESQLLRKIKQGNTAAIIFTLKTQGKSRGYVERNETEHDFSDRALQNAAGLIAAMRQGVTNGDAN